MNQKPKMIILTVLIGFISIGCIWTSRSFAHNGIKHEKHKPPVAAGADLPVMPENNADVRLKAINSLYQEFAKSALLRACGDCHSNHTIKPWYSTVPGIAGMIERDIAEAKEHIDLSHDFPFVGHGSPREDLEAIKESLSKDTMPPWQYNFMHPNKKLSADDKLKVIQWVDSSLLELDKRVP